MVIRECNLFVFRKVIATPTDKRGTSKMDVAAVTNHRWQPQWLTTSNHHRPPNFALVGIHCHLLSDNKSLQSFTISSDDHPQIWSYQSVILTDTYQSTLSVHQTIQTSLQKLLTKFTQTCKWFISQQFYFNKITFFLRTFSFLNIAKFSNLINNRLIYH